MKRFYKNVEIATAPEGFTLRLDSKTLKTPLGKVLLFKTPAHAEEVMHEWRSQGDQILPLTMPITQLTNTYVDKVQGAERPALENAVLEYAQSDLLCYFADRPQDLQQRQKNLWIPLLDSLKQLHGITLMTSEGIRHVRQSADTLQSFKRVISSLDAIDFTVVQALTAPLGSLVLALTLIQKVQTPDEIFQAATVDEHYQMEKWGQDQIAMDRLSALQVDIHNVAKFRNILKGS